MSYPNKYEQNQKKHTHVCDNELGVWEIYFKGNH